VRSIRVRHRNNTPVCAWFLDLKTRARTWPPAQAQGPPCTCFGCGYALANKGHDTRAIQGWLGHRSITSTAVYTALAPNRFKDFWRE
jgi:integrase